MYVVRGVNVQAPIYIHTETICVISCYGAVQRCAYSLDESGLVIPTTGSREGWIHPKSLEPPSGRLLTSTPAAKVRYCRILLPSQPIIKTKGSQLDGHEQRKKGRGRKWSWRNFMYGLEARISPWGSEKTTKTLIEDNRTLGRDLDCRCRECETETQRLYRGARYFHFPSNTRSRHIPSRTLHLPNS
jgi:hypothetical protein